MKQMKTPLLVLALLTVSLVNNAQSISYGIKAGAGVSYGWFTISENDENVSLKDDYDIMEPIRSYGINAFLSLKGTSFWGLTFEPGILQKGYAYHAGVQNVANYNLIQNYLHMPLLVDMFLTEKITLSIGPEFAYLVSTKYKFPNNTEQEGKALFEKSELSAAIGVNYALTNKFDIGVRLNKSINSTLYAELISNQGEITDIKYKQYNEYAQVYLKFKI